jgi:transcriptional regulator GlxA family with amidase domain
VFDGSGLPTAPLIQQCAHENADLALLAICCEPPESTSALLAAARAGARVVVGPSASELRALLRETSRRHPQRPDFSRESFQGVEPAMLRDVLTIAAEVVVEGGHVGALASRLNVSPRTLVRHLHAAGLPSARTLLGVARVLWACAIVESAPSRDMAVTARLCGFATTSRMLRAARHYAVAVGGSANHPILPSYDEALAAAVGAVGGRLDR